MVAALIVVPMVWVAHSSVSASKQSLTTIIVTSIDTDYLVPILKVS